MAITGGPALDLKWGGMILRPTSDGELEYDLFGFDFESKASPNGDVYGEGKARLGYVSQECAMTADEFKTFKAAQDGVARAGTCTCPNGNVLSINGAIEGEHNLSNGKVKVKLAGKVKLQ
jgi:hypothetical protein